MERNLARQSLCALVLLLSSSVVFGQSAAVYDYYLTNAPDRAQSATFRLGNNQSIGWRNFANTADHLLNFTAGDVLDFGGSVDVDALTIQGIEVPTISSTNIFTNKTLDAATNVLTGSYTGITGVGTLAAGTWQANPVDIPYGGHGQTTAQAGINALTGVAGANPGDVLTKVGTDATWAAPAAGGHTIRDRLEAALTDRTFLKFSVPLNATDDAANDQTVAQLDSRTLTAGDPLARTSWIIPIQDPNAQTFEKLTVSQLGGGGAGLADAFATVTGAVGSSSATGADTINFAATDPLLTTTVSGASPAVVTYDFGGTFASLNTAITDATLLRSADIGSTVQAFDASLQSISGLTTAADQMIYTTAPDTWATMAATSFSRGLMANATQGNWQTALDVDPSGTDNSTPVTLAAPTRYLSILGQEITAALVDLASHVTGQLPTANIADNAVTFPKMQDLTGTDLILGTGNTGTEIREISLGSGLQMTGNILSATATGGGHTIQDRDGTGLTQRSNLQFELPLNAVDQGAGPDATGGRIDFSASSGVPALTPGSIGAYKVLVQNPSTQGAAAFGTVTVSELGGGGGGLSAAYVATQGDAGSSAALAGDTLDILGGPMIDTVSANGAGPPNDSVTINFGGTLAELNSAITDATLDDAGDARTPTAHATTHQPGGSDPVAVTTPAVSSIPATTGVSDRLDAWISPGSTSTPGLVQFATDGQSAASVAVQGNDGRLSDARTPTSHAASHQHNGSDEIATATPGANLIPKADAGGDLDAWVSTASTTIAGLVELATDGEAIANRAVQGNDSRLLVGTAMTTEGDLITYQAGQPAKIAAGTLNHYFRSAGPSTVPVYGELDIGHDPTPLLGGNLGTNGELIVVTENDGVTIQALLGDFPAGPGAGFIYSADATPTSSDGGITVEPGRVTMYGTSAVVDGLKHAEDSGKPVWISEEGVLYTTDPPPTAWTDVRTDANDTNLGTGDTPQAWVAIPGFVHTPGADIEIGDVVNVSVSMYIVHGKSGDPTDLSDKTTSVEVGFGVNGATPASAGAKRTIGPYFQGWVTFAFAITAGQQITTTDTIDVFARNGGGDDSASNPWAYRTGATSDHESIISAASSTGGGGGAPTNAQYITAQAEGGLSAEKVLQDGVGTTVDFQASTAAVDWESSKVINTTWADGGAGAVTARHTFDLFTPGVDPFYEVGATWTFDNGGTNAGNFVFTGNGNARIAIGDAGTMGTLRLHDNSNNFFGLTVPTLSADYTLTLPDGVGANNEVLTSNGDGTTRWATGGGGGSAAMDTWKLRPDNANLVTGFGTPDLGSTHHRLLYDADLDELNQWSNIAARNYQGGQLTAQICFTMEQNNTTASVVIQGRIAAISAGDVEDVDAPTFGSAVAATVAVPDAEGQMAITTLVFDDPAELDNLADGDTVLFEFQKTGTSGSDTADGDLEVRWIDVYEG